MARPDHLCEPDATMDVDRFVAEPNEFPANVRPVNAGCISAEG